MAVSRVLLAGLLLLTAAVLQTAVVVRLQLPAGRPDLILIVVVAVAMSGGSREGMWVGFAGGLLADLLADHPVGMLALVFCLVGYASGLPARAPERGVALTLAVVALAAVAAAMGFAVLLAILGNPRLDWHVVRAALPGGVAYDVLMAAFVVPVVAGLHRRLVPQERVAR